MTLPEADGAPAGIPRMYLDVAEWWPLLSIPADYEEEAGIYTRYILGALAESGRQAAARPTLLELGSGGGNNALFFKRVFDCTLSDRAPGMLAVSRALHPDLPHHQGDMRALRLGQQFDVVFLHDAVMYLTSEEELRAAFATAAAHTRPGGVFLVCPDFTAETFRPGADHGGHDGETLEPPQPGRAMRYLEWTFDPDPSDTTCITDYVYMLHDGDRPVQVIYDRHVEGLFPRATWLRLLEEAGFQARAVPFDHSEVEGVTDIFLCAKR